MDIGEAVNAMKVGKKVRRSVWRIDTYLSYGAKIQYGDDAFLLYIQGDTESLKQYHMQKDDILADDWEVIEDIPEVKIKTKVSELYTCPSCKTTYEYFPSAQESVKKCGYFKCGKCGQKIKPLMQTDEEILQYLTIELGREFDQNFKKALIEMSINPPNIITLVSNKGEIHYNRE